MSQNGSVVQRGKKWAAVYRAPDPATGRTRQVWRTFATKKEAQAHLRRQVVAVEDGTHMRPSRQTLAAFVEDDWLPSLEALVAGGKLRSTTVANYRTLIRLHVLPHIGGIPLRALEAPRLNGLYAELLAAGRKDGRGGLSATSVHLVHVTISRALRDAVKWGAVARNVAAMADPPQPANAERTIWTAPQLRLFLDSIEEERLRALWWLLATTGIRRGEAAGLAWPDVDLDGEQVHIRRARVVADYRVLESAPKTEKGRRTIALDPLTVSALRRHRAAQAQERLAWGEAWAAGELVFTKPEGGGLHPETITRTFDRLVRRAGLPRISVHGVRHSYATQLRDAGVPLDVISKRLGHSSLAITGDLYVHRTDEADRAAATAGVERIVGGTR